VTPRLPPLIEVKTIANVLGKKWSVQRTRRLLKRENAAVLRGGYWFATPALLRDNLPELYEALFELMIADEGEPES